MLKAIASSEHAQVHCYLTIVTAWSCNNQLCEYNESPIFRFCFIIANLISICTNTTICLLLNNADFNGHILLRTFYRNEILYLEIKIPVKV